MFPSCGFFSSFPCQFFVNGLCERPYCHFRHSKHDIEKAKENTPAALGDESENASTSSSADVQSSNSEDGVQTSESSTPHSDSSSSKKTHLTSVSSEKPSLPSYSSTPSNSTGSFSIPFFTDSCSYQVPIAEETEQYVSALEEGSDQVPGSSQYSKTDAGASALPTYRPTPKTSSLPAPQPVKNDLSIPVYQPTPKKELKRRHGDQVQTKKAKSSDLEYDPECNFSCGGLIGSSEGKPKTSKSQIENDELLLDYEPTCKKARPSGICNSTNSLSCESLTGSSPNAADEDEYMPDAEFSEEEEESKGTNLVEESMEGVDEEEDNKSDSFENIGDDDISSDDDFIDVPSVSVGQSGPKHLKHSVAKSNDQLSGKTKNGGLKQNQKEMTKHVSSKSSGHKQLSKSSSQKKLEKSLTLSSSHKKTCRSSSSKDHDSRKSPSTSVKLHSAEKSHSSEKTLHTSKHSSQHKTDHSSKTKGSQIHKKDVTLKSSHTHPQNSDKSLQKSSSSDKVHMSSKHSSLTKKTVSSDTKMSASSDGLVSNSSNRRPSVDGKSKITSYKESSSESGTSSKEKTGRSSGWNKHSKTDSVSVKYSNSDSRTDKTKVKYSQLDSKTNKLSVKCSKSDSKTASVKYSDSDSKTTSDKQVNSGSKRPRLSSSEKHSSSDRISSSSRRSSSDSKSGDHHLHSNSHVSSKKDVIAGYHLGDRSTHTGKFHDPNTAGKEQRLSHSESRQKHSSSDKHTVNANLTSLNSHHKKEKSSHRKSDSHSKDRTLEKINSRLFGEDSDDEVAENMIDDDDDPPGIRNDVSDKQAVEEKYIDYENYINASDFEDEDIFDECLRIFKETPAPKKATAKQEKKLVKDQKKDGHGDSHASASIPGKKRIAHTAAEQIRKPQLAKKEKPRLLLSPGEVMHNRIMEMQRKALERATKQAVQEQEVSSTSGTAATTLGSASSLISGAKKRIAHEPKPKPVAPSTSTSKSKVPSSKGQSKVTVAITASKTEKRVAHTPTMSNLKRPVIPASFGSKVPGNIRQRYLNLIIDECLKFCPSEETAYKKGQEEEAGVYERSSNKNIYLRVAVNTITRLRSEARDSLPGSSASKQRQHSGLSQSHEATLGGARAAKTSFSIHRISGKTTEALAEAELFQRLMKYILTEEQLEENGYPRPCPDTPGKAIITGKAYQSRDTLLKDNERNCARCGKRFMVRADGSYINPEECVYHWSRAYPRKKAGFIQHIYNCCSSDTSAMGCQFAANHVHDRNKQDSLHGFMRTMPCAQPRDGNYGIYALDCEMVYTLGGLELARVTVVNIEGESVYESLVQPFNPIVDYNTRFSGLTAADMVDVDTTLTDVQAILLSRFSEKSILIGHSLESDLFALKLIHSVVVDTSVVFPHRLGPPYKRALKNLMLDKFQKIIQGDEGGHDSKEDALACLQLMKWQIKEDSKKERRYSKD